MKYTKFLRADCPRCGDLVLAGWVAGLRVRVSTRTIPRAHAAVLRQYGVMVLFAQKRIEGLHADFWHGQDLDKPDRYLLVPHVCASAHERRTR